MGDPVRYQQRGEVGLIVIDQPPVNALGILVRKGLMDCLEQGLNDGDVGILVLAGKGRGFSGGADIREFGKPPLEPTLRDIISAFEQSTKPVVAAIHGTTLGGGFELALGCDCRVGDAAAKIGLPEVKLGLIPGAGGTQRLPRLIGVEPALRMIASGNPVAAQQAKVLGIFDEVFEDDLIERAVSFAGSILDNGAETKKIRDRTAEASSPSFFEAERKKLARRGRGLIAPWRCIDSVENATTMPFEEGMAKERDYFVECRDSDQSKAQRQDRKSVV